MGGYRDWIGRSVVERDVLSESHLAGLAAVLDHKASPWPSGEAPPLAHWLCFHPDAPQSRLGPDGHPRDGGLIPSPPLPRRMWAGGRLEFHAPLRPGADLERTSTIVDVREKAGATGALVFVTLRHEIRSRGALSVVEEQDLVYREAATATGGATKPTPAEGPPEPADLVWTVVPDPALLFRFSALTFNAHRIHYDRQYARDVEGYGGLVVQGPLLATLLMDQFLRETPCRRVRGFTFRALAPLLDTDPFRLCLSRTARGARLWARDVRGAPTLRAEIEVEAP